jgi:hypothetical protein
MAPNNAKARRHELASHKLSLAFPWCFRVCLVKADEQNQQDAKTRINTKDLYEKTRSTEQ